jgi:hypothetical protein
MYGTALAIGDSLILNLTTMKNFTMICALMISVASFAAHQGEVEILSNSGEQFYVMMNGTYQNYQPQSNVNMRADGNSLSNIKVYAANNNFSFDRNIVVRPNKRVTYSIVQRHGHYSLRFQSEVPLYNFNAYESQTRPPEYHHDDCHTAPVSYTSSNPYNYNGGQDMYYGSANLLSSADFDNLKSAIQQESFSDDKLRVARVAAKSKRLKARQVKEIAQLFTWSDERLKFAKAAYANCIDKQNYYEVMPVFTFSSDKEKLEAFIDAQ